jgi:hypothetical protein
LLRKTMASACMHVRPLLAFVVLLLTVFGGYAKSYALGASESDAALAIAAAEEKIVVCYNAAVEADGAGANVTALLVSLNEAGKLLSRAKLSFEQGDFDSAISLADEVQSNLIDFAAEAEALTETAIWENFWSLFVTVAGSVVGIVVVVLSSFVAWLLIKRRFGRRARGVGS